MGIYSRWIFPRLLRRCMSFRELQEQRRSLLRHARGKVLEIGFGPGLNLPFYSDAVTELTAIDANPGMLELAARTPAPFPLRMLVENAEELSFEDATFDCVVTTWTLCSVGRVHQAMGNLLRVLRPGGSLLFIEHGRSPDPKIAGWQNRLTPLHRRIADGCHLNRDIPLIVTAAGFEVSELERFYLPKAPRILGYTFRGRAVRTET